MSDTHNPDYRLSGGQNPARPPAPPQLPPSPEWQPPNYYQPQPHTFGPPVQQVPPPAAGLPGPVPAAWPGTPAPTLPPLPSIGTIWVNIIIFGWFFGIGLLYAIIQSIRGITISRRHGLSPTKYVVPLVAIFVVLVALVIIGASVGNNHPSNGPTGYGNQGL